MSSSVFILGTRIDNVTMPQALARAEELLAQGESHYIVTPNPEILLRGRGDEQLRAILNKSSLSLCDGTGAYLAALCAGKRLQARVTGVDFMQELCTYAASHGLSIALIGGNDDVREATRKILQKRHPDLSTIARREDESFQADIAFVALGSPKQEKWMARQKMKETCKLMMGVGGAFDMISQHLPRAPIFVRKAGLEWAWRLYLEPARLGRIFSAVIVFPLAVLHTLLS